MDEIISQHELANLARKEIHKEICEVANKLGLEQIKHSSIHLLAQLPDKEVLKDCDSDALIKYFQSQSV